MVFSPTTGSAILRPMNPKPATRTHAIRFGVFRVEIKSQELYKKDFRVKLQNQVFQALALLLERAGKVVTREELRQRIWPGDTFVDFDEGLNAVMKKLRHALGDSAENPRFVETMPRVGYRFIAPVVVEPEPTTAAETQPSKTGPEARPRWRKAFGAKSVLWFYVEIAVAAGVTLAVAAALYSAWRSSQKSGAALPVTINSVAVLPLENLSGDPAQEYFSDGLTDELITDLARFTRLRVISRASIMQYKKTRKTVPEIGRELNVDAIVEGTVERAGDRVRVRAQLIRVRSDGNLWAASYDRDLRDVLQLQEEVAAQIAAEIRRAVGQSLGRPELRPASRPVSLQAYDQYLKGRYFWNQRTPEGFRKSVVCFQNAIDKDPAYAAAYSGLADSYAMMSSYGFVSPRKFMPKARASALKALEIDDSLAEAHTSLAVVAENYDYDWKTAEKEFRRAIELNPSYATAHQWYAESLAFQGRFDEALAESESARQVDPLSLIIATDNAAALYFARQYDRAIEGFQTVLDMAPRFPRTTLIMGAYIEEGEVDKAEAELESWQRSDGDNPWVLAWTAYVYGRAGKRVAAQRALERLKEICCRPTHDPVPLFALAYAGLDDREQTLAWLEKGYQEHSSALTALKVDPAYDRLRPDPRFREMERRVGLNP
jgi:TolB-like protein/DNA-binding winged helix-turn-helix (wHTH) protein/Tfp pilus assembly protein PilF